VVWWFLGFVFLVGFGMLGSLRGVFTPARNGRHQRAHRRAPLHRNIAPILPLL